MKIAICFYGLVGSKELKNGNGEALDPKIAYEFYKKHIFNKNDEIDIFIHSWSIEERDSLIGLYNPKKEIIENQILFPKSSEHLNLYGSSFKSKLRLFLFKFSKNNGSANHIVGKINDSFRAYSRWYSSKKVLELKKEYEEEYNFVYDSVMITRLDVGFFTDLEFKNYDMQYFYASHRNDAPSKENNFIANKENHFKDTQFQDLWFFSNSKNMDKFSLLYDKIEEYGVSPHISSRQHVDKVIGKNKVKYTMYRWFDYELIRRKFFEANE
jgi:hypothetical protein